METFIFFIVVAVVTYNVTTRLYLASQKNKPQKSGMSQKEKEEYTISRQKYWKHEEKENKLHFPHVDHSQDKGTICLFEVRTDTYKTVKERERLESLGIDEPMILRRIYDFVFIDRGYHQDEEDDFEIDDDLDLDDDDDDDDDKYDDETEEENDEDFEEKDDFSTDDYIQFHRIKVFTSDERKLGDAPISYSNAMILHWDSYVDCYVDGFRYEGDVLIVKLRAFFTDEFEFPK